MNRRTWLGSLAAFLGLGVVEKAQAKAVVGDIPVPIIMTHKRWNDLPPAYIKDLPTIPEGVPHRMGMSVWAVEENMRTVVFNGKSVRPIAKGHGCIRKGNQCTFRPVYLVM